MEHCVDVDSVATLGSSLGCWGDAMVSDKKYIQRPACCCSYINNDENDFTMWIMQNCYTQLLC